ncbi:MAG: Holliday junction branch migration protein RuvA [Clostridia bacterium]|nr:Holliday junction branch migration protein RuvA [Clostridia bacterium]
MFYYVKGPLVMTDPQSAVVDCGGVGYKLTISGNTLSHLTEVGKVVCLYTYMSIREDAVELFGFYTTEELNAFKLLITVSGVGPKAAMSILSLMSPEKFAVAVSMGDSKALSKANGVGKKTADRIILELKDKVAKNIDVSSDLEDAGGYASSSVADDAVEALMVLGYPRGVALKAVEGCSGDTLEELMRAALKKIGSNM